MIKKNKILNIIKQKTVDFRKRGLYEYFRSSARLYITEKKARDNYLKSKKYENILSEIQIKDLKQKGFCKINCKTIGLSSNSRITLDDVNYENSISMKWDPETLTNTTLKGVHFGENVHRQMFKIDKVFFLKIEDFLKQISLILSDIHKLSFDLVDYGAYRTMRSNFEQPFSSYLWHIDFMRRSNLEYKVMLFLNDISESNGPMKMSDLSFNRKFMLKKNYRMSDEFVKRKSNNIYSFTGNKFDAYIFRTNNAHKAGKVEAGFREVLNFTFYPGFGNIKLPEVDFDIGFNKFATKIEKGFNK